MTSTALRASDAAEDARLRALEDLGVDATAPEERFDRITRLAQQLFGVSTATVSLIDRDTQWFKSHQGLDVEQAPREIAFCDVTIRRPETLVVEDLAHDERFSDNPYVTDDPHMRFYAGHPLEAAGGERVGTLCLLDARPRRFGETERRVLQELALWTQQELQRSAELEHAAEVQRGLLPRRAPDVPGYDFAGMCLPSRAVGGDFIDWYPQADGHLVFTLGDVMGKGIGAAIMMATVRAAMRTGGRLWRPAEAVRQAAATLEEDLQQTSTLVTLLHARLSTATGELLHADAGHGLELVVRADGSVERGRGDGLPLGALPGERWAEQRTVLGRGDSVVAFSDGLLELYDGTLGAVDEVVRVVRTSAGPREVVARFEALARGRHLPDDVTVVAMRRHP